ncbi:MAG: site-specific integrase [Thermoplasmata archaeon]
MKNGENRPKDPFADIHEVSGTIAHLTAFLESKATLAGEPTLTADARTSILAFVNSQRAHVGDLRIRTYLWWLPKVAARLGAEFLVPTRETPTHFLERFPSSKYAMWTQQNAWGCVARYWRWSYERADQDVPRWLHLTFHTKAYSKVGPADMLTREDVTAIADHTLNHRDRAWIWCLFNSRRRPGEVFRLTLGDVETHPEGYVDLMIRPEKGSAAMPVSLYEDAVPALLAWLDIHPNKGDPSSPLWVGVQGSERHGKQVSYRAMHQVSIEAARRAGIKKPVDPYNFRRSGLTALSKDPAIPYSIFERIGGWVPGSRAPRHYIHISNRDVQDVLNARYGITPARPGASAVPRTPKPCGRCKTLNRSDARFCLQCGGPMDAAAILEMKERNAEALKLMGAAFSSSPDSSTVKGQSEFIASKIVEELDRNGSLQRAVEQHMAGIRSKDPAPSRRAPATGSD